MKPGKVLAFPKPKRVLCELPEGFEVTEGMADWLRRTYAPPSTRAVLHQHEQFMDDARKHGKQFKDWEAAWRTWFRNWCTDWGRFPEGRWAGGVQAVKQSGPQSFKAQDEESARERIQRRDARLRELGVSPVVPSRDRKGSAGTPTLTIEGPADDRG